MITFAARKTRKVAASVSLFALIAAPAVALSQDAVDELAQRELQITEAIDSVTLEHGPQARELIEPLTALTLHYEETGNLRLADTAIERLLSVIRANYGLYSLEQVPSIQLLMAHERERGNAAAAWELEQELIRLGLRNPDDVRTARIFRDVGDGRLDLLERYDAGELPPEIELGCYYNDSNEYRRAQRRGAHSIHTAPGEQHGSVCAAGSRSQAKRSLTSDAYRFYMAAIEVFQRNEFVTSEEFRTLLTRIVHSSYEHIAPSVGRRGLNLLITSYEQSGDHLSRLETLVQLADWDLLFSSVLGTRYMEEAHINYQAAYTQLLEHGAAQESIDALFSPDMPVMLPAFRPNPLVSPETPTSRAHLDVEFIVTAEGESDGIEILETTSADVPRNVRNDLRSAIKHGRFRPIMANGRLADSEPIVIRYFVNP
ncbi:MAG TPA: hypothetical protein VMR74_09715 [Gammaproteobacteria bacterium]|nr:hypothetical protein [Gammaproteobacteria bacterium]